MNKIKQVLSSPRFSVVSMILAVALLLFAGIGGARSALSIFSDDYKAQMDLHDIGVSLVENGEIVSYRDYVGRGEVDSDTLGQNEQGNWDHSEGLTDLEDDVYDPLLGSGWLEKTGDKEFLLGKDYGEVLTVLNSGTVDQYVRVTIQKYWLQADGKTKDTELMPSQIELGYTNIGSDWVEDTDARTDERQVFYYTKLLKCEKNLAEGESNETSPLTETLRINPQIDLKVTKNVVKQENGYTTIKLQYDYDEHQFIIEAKVDAVQDHHAADAAGSAWGRKVTVSDGVLSLVDGE